MKKKVFICILEHMDPLWRRCFDRDILYRDQLFVPYSDLEKFWIEDNITLCKKYPFYKFELESVLVLKTFLEKNPEYEEDISRLLKNGQMEVSFSGNNIIDSNMVQGESLIRNLLNGYYYLKDKFNYCNEGLDRSDGFGNAAQLPQIARGFGSKWIKNIAYVPCQAPYWEGIDGSRIYNLVPPRIGSCGSFFKYRPCPVCHGLRDSHCDHCNDRRIDTEHMDSYRPQPQADWDALENLQIPGYIHVGGEEILPTEDIIRWVNEHSDDYDISFATFRDYLPFYEKEIALTDDPQARLSLHPSVELNPSSSGCFVSRIKTKQYVRLLENRLAAAEALCSLQMLSGKAYPADLLNTVWEKAFFAMFHDAITGTHVDAAYEELMDVFREANQILDGLDRDHLKLPAVIENSRITVFNPNGITVSSTASVQVRSECEVMLTDQSGETPAILSQICHDGIVQLCFAVNSIPAFSAKTYQITPQKAPCKTVSVDTADPKELYNIAILQDQFLQADAPGDCQETIIENEFYTIKALRNGITEIFDKKLGHAVAKESEYMVGEWILEHDEGSPWATLSEDMRRTRLMPDTQLIRIEKNDDIQTLIFQIKPANVRASYIVFGFEIIYRISLVRNCDMIYFSSDVRWDTYNHRLRIAIPAVGNGRHMYDVPYAYLERQPYTPQILLPNNDAEWNNASGDYPAIHWAGIEKEAYSLALFNKGTPSYQIRADQAGNDTVYLTPLRSPAIPTCLHEPLSYSMQEYDGMRDTGMHHFEYALKSYAAGFSENDATADGIGYNSPLIVLETEPDLSLLPVLTGSDVRISTVKCAENKGGLILRLAEYHGKDTTAALTLPNWVTAAYETDMKEEVLRKLEIQNGALRLNLHHFEIKTLYLEF